MSEAKQFNIGGIPIKVKDEYARETLESLRNNLSFGLAGAGIHNSLFRGKCLGDSFTDAQKAAVAAGTFDDMYVGDYWTIGGINWRIAHFDYWLRCGDAECTKHHVVIVPDTCLYNAQMHNTASGQYEAGAANTTEGGYIGSDMYKTGLAQAKATINNAFGAAHVLSHRELLVNAVTNGRPSNHAWYDSTVELMNEPMVYGSYIFTPACDGTVISYRYTIDKSQLALFALRPDLICNRADWWLRDVVSGAYFCHCALVRLCLLRPRFLRLWRAPGFRHLLILYPRPLWAGMDET